MRGRKDRCRFNGLAEPLSESLLLLVVVRNLFEEFILCFLEEAHRLHRARRRAAAKTSSAGMSLASPRS